MVGAKPTVSSCVVVCCSVLQSVVVRCSALQCVLCCDVQIEGP